MNARAAFLVGLVGLAGAMAGLLLAPRAALIAWLAAILGWSAVPIGCLGLLMMVLLIPGRWRPLLAPPLAAGAALLPLAALLFVPVLAGLWQIYPWTDPDVAVGFPAFKSLWLSPAFFILRAILYFAVLIGLQRALLAARGEARSAVAAAGVIAYGLIGSLLGVDWAESIQPAFHSSIYGLLFLTSQWLAGGSFALLLALRGKEEAPPLLAGVFVTGLLMWGYMQAMQYIVIWSGDIPREAIWYVQRSETPWVFATWGLVALQFVLPFLALLSPAVRTSAAAMRGIALLTLAMQLLEAAWFVLPPTGLPFFPTALLLLAAWCAIGGLGAAFLLRFGPQAAERIEAGLNFSERSV